MDKRIALIYGVSGQVVEWFPPEWDKGVPSAATLRVFRGDQSNDDTPVLTPAVTVDATNLALSSAAGYSQVTAAGGRKRIPLASTAGLVLRPRPYLIENNEGPQRELLRLARIVANQYVENERDLFNDYASGVSFVKGLRLSWTMDTTFVSTLNNLNSEQYPYRAEWSYTIGGGPARHWIYFDIVRAAKQTGVTVEDLIDVHSSLFLQEPRDQRNQLAARLLEAGWKRLQKDLMLMGVDPNTIAEGQLLDELHVGATLLCAAENGRCPPNQAPADYLRQRLASYRRDLELAVTGNQLKKSENQDGSITPDPCRPMIFVR